MPKPQQSPARDATIHVMGDAYSALFCVKRGSLFLDGINSNHAHVYTFPVGTEYIYRAIKAACAPSSLLKGNVVTVQGVQVSRSPLEADGTSTCPSPVPLYMLSQVGTTFSHDDVNVELPRLRVLTPDTHKIELEGLSAQELLLCGRDPQPENLDVLVHWIGELGVKARTSTHVGPIPCKIHIQVGLHSALDAPEDQSWEAPQDTATPSIARIVVVNVGEISSSYRVRRSLSYEAIAVDILRLIRGVDATAVPRKPLLDRLSICGDRAASVSLLVIRLNNSAVMIYASRRTDNNEDAGSNKEHRFKEIGAWLLCHRQECAPLSAPELGSMVGYTGFVSSHLACTMAHVLTTHPQLSEGLDEQGIETFMNAVFRGVRRSLGWQRINHERGSLSMLLKRSPKDGNWRPTVTSAVESRTGYEEMFSDIVNTIVRKGHKLQDGGSFSDQLCTFDDYFEEDILTIRVQIKRAVAHRTQWFMARSIVANTSSPPIACEDPRISDDDLRRRFLETAIGWLCDNKDPRKSSIPVVTIGDADLTDRREIEDFLAIHQTLTVYSTTTEAKPLNLAVFGSPGAGKSFAVNQVVKHIGKSKPNVFKRDPLTFNVGQFKSLDDLPAVLHLVRNECLSNDIPIVFFDEFDSSFNSQPFGWLKYFLAPMQDGEFYHAGQSYKMGRAVFVFAGGVNRSFEEFNGRVRNPGFCEAKGPDFISRLKAHLNVQGINRPEGEADQFRYILRRGVLLRSILRRRMGLDKDSIDGGLLHPSVANALLKVDRFKHGVRSLEAIIRMCTFRPGYPIGPSDLPSMDQLEMHVDAMKLLSSVDEQITGS